MAEFGDGWCVQGVPLVMVFCLSSPSGTSVNNAHNTDVSQQGLPLLGKCHRGLNVCLPCLSLFPFSLPSSVPSFLLLWDPCGRSMGLHRISDQRGLIMGWVPSSLWGGRSIHLSVSRRPGREEQFLGLEQKQPQSGEEKLTCPLWGLYLFKVSIL